MLEKNGRGGFHHMDRTEKINIDLITQLCHGQFFMGTDQFVSRIVDEDIKATFAFDDLIHCGLARRGVGDVKLQMIRSDICGPS